MSQMFVPPGYRFHPTDEELVGYYLNKKLTDRTFEGNVIPELDMLQMEPWELPDFSSLNDTEWYFFSPKDKKYPKGSKSNRATPRGYWKSTGRDRPLAEVFPGGCHGIKKTLVFYLGRGNLGSRTDWVMHEFRIEGDEESGSRNLDAFVLCRVYNKKGNVKNFSRSRAKRANNSCEDEHQSRALKGQKVSNGDSSPFDVKSFPTYFKPSAACTADAPDRAFGCSSGLDMESSQKVDLDANSDLCFDHDSSKSPSHESNSESSPKSFIDSVLDAAGMKASRDYPGENPNAVLSSDKKSGSAKGLANAKESRIENCAYSCDNLSADESVTSVHENDCEIYSNSPKSSSVITEVKSIVTENGLHTSDDCDGENEGKKVSCTEVDAAVDACSMIKYSAGSDGFVPYFNGIAYPSMNTTNYADYLSYFSFEESMRREGRNHMKNDCNTWHLSSLPAPLALKADSPLVFANGGLEKSCDFGELSTLTDEASHQHIEKKMGLSKSLSKSLSFESTMGSAFVKFCSKSRIRMSV